MAVVSTPPSLVARLAAGGVGISGLDEVEQLVSPGLGAVDNRATPRPVLADALPSVESGLWKISPDGRMDTTWRIKPSARWHDGRAVTADDVLFTAVVDQDQDVPMRRTPAYRSIDRIEAPDSLTITIRWKEPYILADRLFMAPLFPSHLLERAYFEQKDTFTERPYWSEEFVGTGPFKVREFARGSHLLLQSNVDYALGRPKLDELEIKFIPDQNTVVANVLAGAIELTVGRGISLDQATQLRNLWSSGRIDMEFNSWVVIYPQFVNPNPAAVGDPRDPRLRRALMHAMDRQQMAETLQSGLTPVADTFVHPSVPEFDQVQASLVRYPYDLNRAEQLLAEIGYRKGADGTLRDAAGERLAFELRAPPDVEIQIKSTLAAASYWQNVGVTVEPLVIPEQRIRDREYMQTFPAFVTFRQPATPNDFLLRLYSYQTPLPENSFVGKNWPRYMNPEFDALIDRYYTTIPRPERTQILAQVINHITDRLTTMGLFFDGQPVAISSRLRNVAAAGSSDSTVTWNAEQWDVQT